MYLLDDLLEGPDDGQLECLPGVHRIPGVLAPAVATGFLANEMHFPAELIGVHEDGG